MVVSLWLTYVIYENDTLEDFKILYVLLAGKFKNITSIFRIQKHSISDTDSRNKWKLVCVLPDTVFASFNFLVGREIMGPSPTRTLLLTAHDTILWRG